MSDLAARRLKTVRDHMALECSCDWDGVIATFEHPRYEMYGPGTVFDGEAQVRGYFAASRKPFPDQANRAHDLSGRAESALQAVMRDERGLDGMQLIAARSRSRARLASRFWRSNSTDLSR